MHVRAVANVQCCLSHTSFQNTHSNSSHQQRVLPFIFFIPKHTQQLQSPTERGERNWSTLLHRGRQQQYMQKETIMLLGKAEET